MGAAIAGLIGKALDALARIFPFIVAWRGGSTSAERDTARATARVKDEQARIAARPAAGRDAVLERMRRDDL